MIPPTKAWEELLGIAIHQVNKFQTIAPIKAATMICSSICSADFTISPPIVLATPVLYIAPKKFKKAAIMIAVLGFKALVDTDVAIALAVS